MKHGWFHPHEAEEVTLRLTLQLCYQGLVVAKELASLDPRPHPYMTLLPPSQVSQVQQAHKGLIFSLLFLFFFSSSHLMS